jgi:hypothetical protein
VKLDLATLLAIGGAIASCVSIIIAFMSYRTARAALRLNERLAARKTPRLVLSLLDGHARQGQEHRTYSFLLSVSNTSDTDNSIARFDLRLEYRNARNFCAKADVAASSLTAPTIGPDAKQLVHPADVRAHQTIVGWVHFRIPNAMILDCHIDTYAIVTTDTHSDRTVIEATAVRDVVDETSQTPSTPCATA